MILSRMNSAVSTAKALCRRLRELARGLQAAATPREVEELFTAFERVPVDSLNEQDISMYLDACGKLHRVPEVGYVDELIERAKRMNVTSQGFASIVNSMSSVSSKSRTALTKMASDPQLVKSLSAWQVAVVMQGLSRLEVAGIPELLLERCIEASNEFTARGVSMVVDALARQDHNVKHSVKKRLIDLVLAKYAKLPSSDAEQELFVVMNALSKLNVRDSSFVHWWRQQREVHEFTNQAVANLALAFARLGYDEVAADFIDEFITRAKHMRESEPQHISLVLYACSLIDRLPHSVLFDLLSQHSALSLKSQLQVLTALISCRDVDKTLRLCSVQTLKRLRDLTKIAEDEKLWKTAVFEAQKFRSSKLHEDVKTAVLKVATAVVSEEVGAPPFFVDLVIYDSVIS